MVQWQEVLAIVGSITLSDQKDQMIWMYEFNWIYSSKIVCALINYGGVKPIYLPAV
jgi:hypothetical protein